MNQVPSSGNDGVREQPADHRNIAGHMQEDDLKEGKEGQHDGAALLEFKRQEDLDDAHSQSDLR